MLLATCLIQQIENKSVNFCIRKIHASGRALCGLWTLWESDLWAFGRWVGVSFPVFRLSFYWKSEGQLFISVVSLTTIAVENLCPEWQGRTPISLEESGSLSLWPYSLVQCKSCSLLTHSLYGVMKGPNCTKLPCPIASAFHCMCGSEEKLNNKKRKLN